MKPHLFLARAGYAIIWERFVMGKGTETWVLCSTGKPCAWDTESFPTASRWLFGSSWEAKRAFEKWLDSRDFIPESEFKVCEVQGAFTAREVEE